MNVFLHTLGCRLNEAELEAWTREFRGRGHQVVTAPEGAHVMVLNTCAVTREAARKSRKTTAQLHRKNPSARLVLTGCFAELEPDTAAALAGVDLVIGNLDKERLVERVEQELVVEAMPSQAADPDGTHVYRETRTRAFIKVQDGCRNRCTFCIVTIARGAERSRPIPEIVAELNALGADGYQEAVLTGVHLGGYGADLGTDLATLVRALARDTDIPRLRLSSLEPWDLPEDFGALWDCPRLMPHLHLPLQSGSDAVLKRMARRCDTSSYAALVDRLRGSIPDLAITTDIITGFPGETDDEWAETLAFVESMRFSHVHIFTYSRRAGTTAARMAAHVPAELARARTRELHAVAAGLKAAHLEGLLGQIRPVLWEGSAQAAGAGMVRYAGYTDHYARVETLVPAAPDSPGSPGSPGSHGSIELENRVTRARLCEVVGDPPDRVVAELV
jgi:threonylcarbamoyladenosine tRNA methylthiotransferase MtaB